METGELTEEDAVRVHHPTSTEFLELCIVQYYTMNSLLCVLVVDGEQLLQPMSFQFWRGSDTFLRFFRFDANSNLLRIDMWGLSRSCSGPMNKQLTKTL